MFNRTTTIPAIDDDALPRHSPRYRLDREGYAVTKAKAGEKALTFARRDHPDLVLLDMGLPDRNGLDIARTLQNEIDVPIILITSRRDETDIVLGLASGARILLIAPERA